MTNNYGSVDHNGTTINLTQPAYPDNYGTDGGVRYYAQGNDAQGNEYSVAWDTTQAWDDLQAALRAGEEPASDAPDPNDESVACDWDSPAYINAL